MNSTPRLLLASNSPRRHQIFQNAGYSFDVKVIDVDESYPDDLQKEKVGKFLAQKKNKAYRALYPQHIIITADTTVLYKGELLEKAANAAEAFQMLTKLSGNSHQVITGVCCYYQNQEILFDDKTDVTFYSLSNEEINYYIATCQPYDKAGSYGVQDWIGLTGVKSMNGNFYNVMGLPIHLLYRVLKENFGVTPSK